jgi:hypothetical protein
MKKTSAAPKSRNPPTIAAAIPPTAAGLTPPVETVITLVETLVTVGALYIRE